jgi:murein DD-endopeptidase MepM/ murein hydrolase activator NlpD
LTALQVTRAAAAFGGLTKMWTSTARGAPLSRAAAAILPRRRDVPPLRRSASRLAVRRVKTRPVSTQDYALRLAPFLGLLLTVPACAPGTMRPAANEPTCSKPDAAASARTAAAATAPVTPEASTRLPVDAVALEIVRSINAKDAKLLVSLFGVEMANALPESKALPFITGIATGPGHINAVERLPGDEGARDGKFKLTAERGELRMDLHVDRNDKVTGMSITSAPAAEPPVAKSTLPLVLPFRGQWLAVWGGDKIEVNRHLGHKSQRRAVDLVMVDKEGKTHRGDGRKNDDFFAYGQDVVAVADGTVVTVIDGVPENAPGELNPAVLAGNSVVVKHSDSLFSFYAHLQPGKIRVRVGTKVGKGALLGVCGNSGNSTEPHLHFQLQDAPLFEKSWGVEPIFHDVTVVRDGKPAKLPEYTWLKGDLVGEPSKK